MCMCVLLDFEHAARLPTSLGVQTPLKNHFGVSSAVRAGELSAIESAVTVLISELLSICVARSDVLLLLLLAICYLFVLLISISATVPVTQVFRVS
ncbi:hypothetical protein AVEN_77144-1 [Araneus ventricosus]|uniref:Uncharacterized protein n=1 Tax=Araneus ventricosus TaxID=182803 RepID=A0A4Y2SU22_ARAVE|nr:hypothetical protein AVEN_265850-1 [Araneus ventricosus]GBN93263.1 hypothetical protein AVEN_77144-1 [Araneus ventricosus]